MTKNDALAKMNRRHGTQVGDYFMMLAWLRQAAERCERRGALYVEQASEYRADHAELLAAEESEQRRPTREDRRHRMFDRDGRPMWVSVPA
jgi:hypothetical protein